MDIAPLTLLKCEIQGKKGLQNERKELLFAAYL